MMMRVLFIHIILLLISLPSFAEQPKGFLLKPDGHFGVSYEDLRAINTNLCPDPNINKDNYKLLSPSNKRLCHEILLRIYYPTAKKEGTAKENYYRPFVDNLIQKIASTNSHVLARDLASLRTLKSYVQFHQKPVSGQKFPVLFFSPGLGCQVQMYENTINNLVSHGYVVIGINSMFVSGDLFLPGKQIAQVVALRSVNDIERKSIQIQAQDLAYSISHLQDLKNLQSYRVMDFEHIGAFGHSLGGRVVADYAHTSPNKLQAATSLDTAIDPSGISRTRVRIPFMHQISANKISCSAYPIKFDLGKNGYLVTISPNDQDITYSYHMNFTDFSTLQYHPAIKGYIKTLENSAKERFTLKIYRREPSNKEISSFSGETYILVKKKSNWVLTYYLSNNKVIDLEVKNVKGLNDFLLGKNDTGLSKNDQESIKKMLLSFRKYSNQFVGKGNGWLMAKSINLHLLTFFDMYLKNLINIRLKQCQPLTRNTHMQCGK